MPDTPPFNITVGTGPLVAAAIHDGHTAHPETLKHFALNEAERLREEDPYTAELAKVLPTRIIGCRTRFEVDLNRSIEESIYTDPDSAWGLTVWKEELPESVRIRSMELYRTFYSEVERLLSEKIAVYGKVVVYDIHSYNHLREGPQGLVADPNKNPEVNIGTGTLDRGRWGELVETFMIDLRAGGKEAGLGMLDVRENIKFQGGHFSKWIHRRFGASACVLAIEFKKTFMDEWTGVVDPNHLSALREALAFTIPGVCRIVQCDT